MLTEALNGLARTWRPIASTALMVFVPIGLLSLLVFRWTDGIALLDLVFTDPEALETIPEEELRQRMDDFLTAAAIAGGLQTLATIFVYLATHRIMTVDLVGLAATGREARRWAASKYLRAVGAAIVAIVVVAGLAAAGILIWSIPFGSDGIGGFVPLAFFLACIGPAFWLAVAFSMMTPVVAVEQRGVFASLMRSLELVRVRWGPTLGYLAIVGLLGIVATQLIQIIALPLASIEDPGFGVSIASLAGLFAQGIIVGSIGAMWTGWYFDLRARREALTIEDLG